MFVAEAVQESDAKRRAVKIAIEVEHKGFDRRFILAAECRTHTDVRNASAPNAVDEGSCRVNAIFWDDAVVSLKICGREADRMAAAVTTDDDAFDAVRPPQHSAGVIHAACKQVFTDLR